MTTPTEGAKQQPEDEGPDEELERSVEAMVARIARLDELGLDGVEPATTFGFAPR